MFEWIVRLFRGLDRTTAAADRAGAAVEDIATLLEQARDQLRARLGHVPAPAALTVEEKPEEPAKYLSPSNGRRKQPAAG